MTERGSLKGSAAVGLRFDARRIGCTRGLMAVQPSRGRAPSGRDMLWSGVGPHGSRPGVSPCGDLGREPIKVILESLLG